ESLVVLQDRIGLRFTRTSSPPWPRRLTADAGGCDDAGHDQQEKLEGASGAGCSDERAGGPRGETLRGYERRDENRPPEDRAEHRAEKCDDHEVPSGPAPRRGTHGLADEE